MRASGRSQPRLRGGLQAVHLLLSMSQEGVELATVTRHERDGASMTVTRNCHQSKRHEGDCSHEGERALAHASHFAKWCEGPLKVLEA
jgi:hypothetical protein